MADGSRTRHLRSHNPVLYLMSYGHHREVLKTLTPTRPSGRKVGRGREIRTPDILLPKQARYQTALYPDLSVPTQAPAPVFRRAHNTHLHGERQRHIDDFTTVSETRLFHCYGSSWENTRDYATRMQTHHPTHSQRIPLHACNRSGWKTPRGAKRS